MICHKPSIIYVGRGQIAANSPIKMKKHVRCPGTRKLIRSFQNRGNCVVRMVDENNTSQQCLKRFPAGTKSYRYKKCTDCQPNPILLLPSLIVTDVSKQILQMRRTIEKEWRRMSNAGGIVGQIAADLFQQGTRRLVSKKKTFSKIWQPNANVNDGTETHTTVWHRDISAAKLILYRGTYERAKNECFIFYTNQFMICQFFIDTGHCELHGLDVHSNLLRRNNNNHAAVNRNAANP